MLNIYYESFQPMTEVISVSYRPGRNTALSHIPTQEVW